MYAALLLWRGNVGNTARFNMLVSSALFGDMGLYWMSAGLQVTMTEILSDIPQALHDVITSIFSK
jgi:hypothetical protein